LGRIKADIMKGKISSIVIKEGKQYVELEFEHIVKPETMPLEMLTVGWEYDVTFERDEQIPEFNT
jgi:hypothetical protein